MWKLPARGVSKPYNLSRLHSIVEDGPVVHGDDRCRCQCHRIRTAGALHLTPCCRCCQHCRQNIVEAKYADHVKRCIVGAGRNP